MKKTIFAFLALCVFLPASVEAAEYDFYVDKSYSGEESDGSKEMPFKTIAKAIEQALKNDKSGRKIYVKNGEYPESPVLGENVKLIGQNREKTVIKVSSQLQLDGNNLLKSLTVSGGSPGVMVYGKAEIDNCTIKNAGKVGIKTAEKTPKLTVRNSEISKNGKGFYIQKGSEIELINNKVFNNLEEGIDIRENISGIIKGNEIFSNGEPGIEIIVGSADILISGNDIRKNKASGIATQFYTQASKKGNIKLLRNTIVSNGGYGIRCSAPSGGSPSSETYWNDSLDLVDNKIENNKNSAINRACKLIRAVTDEEVKKNQIIESENSKADDEEEERKFLLELEEKRIAEEKENELRAKIKESQDNIEEFRVSILVSRGMIQNLNRTRVFLLGSDSKIRGMEKEAANIRGMIESAGQYAAELKDEEERNPIETYLNEQKSELEALDTWMAAEKNKFSLFGWLFRIFQK
ncbi:MAG TPA: hypothetical protein DIT25_01475 [Candidatus Moranbacteria bacterium]|nr:hypothetical protein [Candidatus Moranbacteria bacterium]